MESKKFLVTYFSCTNNTKKLAEKINGVVKGDLLQIKPETPYTQEDLNWQDKNSRTTKEMADKKSRPKVANKIDNLAKYDVVMVGFPIWWYIAPTIVNTFLEQHDFSGKIVIPFATSGGSREGETDKYLKPSCKGANYKPAKRFDVGVKKDDIEKWVKSLL